jgi:glucokinase
MVGLGRSARGATAEPRRPSVSIGVDVGGTTIAAGVVADDGRVLAEARVPTRAGGPRSAERTILELIASMTSDPSVRDTEVLGIGIGVPALVDAETGTVGPEVPHVPELADRPLASIAAAASGMPVFVDNDVNALALAEARFGAGRDAASLVVLAAGTGFGSGIVLNGGLVRGARGLGAELGHAPVKFDGRPCWCGGRGCLAVYASGRGIAEAARARVAGRADTTLLAAAGGDPMRITAETVFEAAGRGDAHAAAVVEDACRALGAMIAVIVNGLNPDVVVVTGGVAAAFALLERRVLAAAAEHALARAIAATRVVIVPGDKRVTMRGAAALVRYELDRRAARYGARRD